MEGNLNGLPKLDGTQRLYFEENGKRLAVVTAMAQSHLRGAHISLSAAPVVDGRSLGLAIIQLGFCVLRMEEHIDERQMKGWVEMIEEMLI